VLTDAPGCKQHAGKKDCKAREGCTWNKKQLLCFDDSFTLITDAPKCERLTRKKPCKASGCTWNNKEERCLSDDESATTPGFAIQTTDGPGTTAEVAATSTTSTTQPATSTTDMCNAPDHDGVLAALFNTEDDTCAARFVRYPFRIYTRMFRSPHSSGLKPVYVRSDSTPPCGWPPSHPCPVLHRFKTEGLLREQPHCVYLSSNLQDESRDC
jgi:hypothetical protein